MKLPLLIAGLALVAQLTGIAMLKPETKSLQGIGHVENVNQLRKKLVDAENALAIIESKQFKDFERLQYGGSDATDDIIQAKVWQSQIRAANLKHQLESMEVSKPKP